MNTKQNNFKIFSFWVNAAFIAFLHMCDIFTTLITIKLGGVEGNPLMVNVVSSLLFLIVFKLFVVCFTLWVLALFVERSLKAYYRLTLFNNIFYIGVIINNFIVMYSLV